MGPTDSRYRVRCMRGALVRTCPVGVIRAAEMEWERLLFRTLADASPQPLVVTDPERSRFYYVNPAWELRFGWKREEVGTLNLPDCYPRGSARILAEIAASVSSPSAANRWEGVLEVLDVQGQSHFLRTRVRALRKPRGKKILAWVLIHDEHEEFPRDKSPSQKEEPYRQVVESQDELICRFLPDGTITFFNGAFGSHFGLSPGERTAANLFSLVPAEEHQRLRAFLNSPSPDFPSFTREYRIPQPGGGFRWLQWTDRAIFDAKGRISGFQSVGRDITEQRITEEVLREARRELLLAVRERTRQLEEANTALKVLLNKRDEDEIQLRESILSNIRKLVLPNLERLMLTRLDEKQTAYLHLIRSNLEEVSSPFLRGLSLSFPHLSPMETQVAALIADGRQNKEIASLLGISLNTVLTHRYHLREKLGLKKAKVNLQSFLKTRRF